MKIDWAALGIVAVVSVLATVLFVALLAGGIRLVGASTVAAAGGATNGHRPAGRAGGSGPARVVGFALLGCAGLLVVLGIYLILPFAT